MVTMEMPRKSLGCIDDAGFERKQGSALGSTSMPTGITRTAWSASSTGRLTESRKAATFYRE